MVFTKFLQQLVLSANVCQAIGILHGAPHHQVNQLLASPHGWASSRRFCVRRSVGSVLRCFQAPGACDSARCRKTGWWNGRSVSADVEGAVHVNRLGFAGGPQTQKAHAVAATHPRPHGGPSWAPEPVTREGLGEHDVGSHWSFCESAAFRRIRNIGTALHPCLDVVLTVTVPSMFEGGDGGAASFGDGRGERWPW